MKYEKRKLFFLKCIIILAIILLIIMLYFGFQMEVHTSEKNEIYDEIIRILILLEMLLWNIFFLLSRNIKDLKQKLG